MPQERSAGAVIFRDENGKRLFLLLHYASGHWEFVKGKIESGEKENETIVREAKEETGIGDLRLIDGFRETVEYFFRRDGQTVHKEVVFWVAETKTKNIVLSQEHIGFDWLLYDAAIEKLTYDNAKNVIRSAQEFLKSRNN